MKNTIIKNKNKYLLKNTLIFTIGNFASKLISFLLIPLYTNILNAEQYGIVDLIVTVSMVAVPIFTLNIYESVMRFALDKEKRYDEITKIGLNIYLISCIVALIIIPICCCFQQISQFAVLTYFYVISSAGSQLLLCDLRGKEKLVHYSLGNIINTFLIGILTFIFLVFCKMEIVGLLLAYVISNFITAFYALIVGNSLKFLKINKINNDLMKKMIKYSIVLIPNSFMWWIMNSSDRIMVTTMLGIAANGIYAISYKLPSLVSTITTIFNQAWGYSAIKEKNSKDEEKYNNYIFTRYIAIVMFVAIGILTFLKLFLKFYVSAEYFDAWRYSTFLIVGCVYLTLGTFMSTSYSVHKDSYGFLYSSIFGAVFNIAFNFILIPFLGIYGAAISTCISYILVFLFRLFHTRKYMKYDVKNLEFLGGTIILIISVVLVYISEFWNFVFVVQLALLLLQSIILVNTFKKKEFLSL